MNRPLRRPLDPFLRLRFQRGVQHVHRLGERPLMECFLEIAHRIGGMSAIFAILAEYENISPAMLHVTGNRFVPPALHLVPSPSDDMEEWRHERVG
jgi:hypothetical protein